MHFPANYEKISQIGVEARIQAATCCSGACKKQNSHLPKDIPSILPSQTEVVRPVSSYGRFVEMATAGSEDLLELVV
jgi:hypothetical protein